MAKTFLKVQNEISTRYRRIADLWVAYHAQCDDGPEEFGREFYHAVGELLQGSPLNRLELFHIKPACIERVVFTGRKDDEQQDEKHKVKKRESRGKAGSERSRRYAGKKERSRKGAT